MDSVLSQIFIYPVKSLGSYELPSVRVEPKGLENDRRFMIVKADGGFLSQREYPKLASIEVSLNSGGAMLSHGLDNRTILRYPDPVNEQDMLSVRIWESELLAISADRMVNDWISEFLGAEAAIVYMPDSVSRLVNRRFNSGGDVVSFADGYPVLLVNAESVRAISEKAGFEVPVDRFRPNLIVEGLEAFSEDRWERIRVGAVVFRIAKPCVRCVVTTIDQKTGEKGIGEPLRTLAEFRKAGLVFPDAHDEMGLGSNDVLFGVYLIPESEGASVATGDRFEVLEARDQSS